MTTTNSYICSNCGQEFNPPNHVCTPKPVTNANSTVNTGLYSHDIKAEIVAARDKWWVVKMETDFAKALLCDYYPECETCYRDNNCHVQRWHVFKREVGQ
jgi:hypothetical protein